MSKVKTTRLALASIRRSGAKRATQNSKLRDQTYKPAAIEPKWQKRWAKERLYKTSKPSGNKKYILDMFPYPSGATMHVGHLEGYVGTDIIARYQRMKGKSVLHPMGWDSFGLPAENYAIKTGIHPEESTRKNRETFKRQLESTGLSYDWDREINTSDHEYYKWNQWLFILLFKRGLAYKAEANVNWCPSCETVLANEQVVDQRCERCEAEVVQKKLDQWFLKITAYADRLLSGLDHIDWLDEVKVQQKSWIGRSEGLVFTAAVKDSELKIQTFSAHFEAFRADTFVVIAPDHPLLEELVKDVPNKEEVLKFAKQIVQKRESEGYIEEKNPEGIFTGRYIVDPVGNGELPIWVANFAIKEYGTGIVKCSAHDERDFAFAKKYGIRLKPVLFPKDEKHRKRVENLEECYTDMVNGYLAEPEEFAGQRAGDIRQEIVRYVVEHGLAEVKTQYHLRDWLISRQRYWGTPIPMICCEACAKKRKGEREDMPGWYPVAQEDLPVLLPKDVDFRPTGQSPITRSKSFQENVVCPACTAPARREVDTMDGYVDSSWYFIRFADPKNNKEFASQKTISDWLPVDIYVGGGHVVQHLLFARFFWKVLFDEGLIDKSLGDEPFLKLRAPGWILGPDARKMSKRWNNVVTPDDIIPKYGADTLRMYEMFMGPFEAMKPWSLAGVEGMWRFINKIWRLFSETWMEKGERNKEVDVLIHRLIQKVENDIEGMKFNTAISTMMETYNALVEMRRKGVNIAWGYVWERFLLVMAPFAPHITEELWQRLAAWGPAGQSAGPAARSSQGAPSSLADAANEDARLGSPPLASPASLVAPRFTSIHTHPWPSYDPTLLEEEEATIVVQVDGRVRDTIQVKSEKLKVKSYVEEKAKESERVRKYLEGKKVKRVVYVEGKIINFVTQ